MDGAIRGTNSGSLLQKRFVAEMLGEYNEKGPVVTVNNNTLNAVSEDIVTLARQIVKEKTKPVIDIL
jgi:hypothetical protein